MCSQEAAPLVQQIYPEANLELLKPYTLKLFEIENIISEKKGGYNTAGVVFFLILYNQTRSKSINTIKTVLVFLSEKVLPEPRKSSSGVRKIQRTEHRNQMTDDKGQTVFCLLSSDLCSLLSDNGHRCLITGPLSPDGITLNRRGNKGRNPLLQLGFGLTAIIRECNGSTGA